MCISGRDNIADIGGSDSSPAMRIIIALLVLVLTVGCSQGSSADAEIEGTAVFFNFYDEPVETYVDDELLFSERLDVDDSSTGLSKTIGLGLNGCSQIKVVTSSRQAERQVCPEKSGFGLWVSPSSSDGQITIKFEEVFTPALD